MVPSIFVRGNHDSEHPFAHAYTDAPFRREKDWYSFCLDFAEKTQADNCRAEIFFLNSNCHSSQCTSQTEWLKSSLEKSNSLWKLVFFHTPAYTEMWDPKEPYNGEEWIRREWVPLFEKYGVDFVFSGHTHAYLRGKKGGVNYVITGGGGGDLDKEKAFDWKGLFQVTKAVHHMGIIRFNTDSSTSRITWEARDLQNIVIDNLSLSKTIRPQ